MFDVSKLELRPKDVLVLKTEREISKDEIAFLGKYARKRLKKAGLKNKVFVLAGGLSIEVIRRAG